VDDSLEFADVFRALGEWARTATHGVRAGGGARGFDYIQLHTRPDPREPEVQLTFRAQLVEGRPVIAVSRSPAPSAPRRPQGDGAAVVTLGTLDDETSRRRGRDPAATCEACGVLGTVGRAVRTDGTGGVTEMHRFCIDCWPEQSARYRARWEEQDRRQRDAFLRGRAPAAAAGPGMWFEAATWHGILDLVRQIERAMIAPVPPAADDLARIATEIREQAAEVEGEMPREVEGFLQRYGAPTSAEGA
jgi:hypothetical protein